MSLESYVDLLVIRRQLRWGVDTKAHGKACLPAGLPVSVTTACPSMSRGPFTMMSRCMCNDS